MTELEPVPVSAKNPRIKRLRLLVQRRKTRSEERVFVVDGPVLVADALRSPCRVKEIYVGDTAQDLLVSLDEPVDFQVKAGGGDPEVFVAESSVLSVVLDPKNPQPVAAVVEMPTWTFEDLGRDGHLLGVDQVRDPGNLGAILRTAEASGAAGVVMVGDTVDAFSPKVVRASAGSILRVPVVSANEYGSLVNVAATHGRTIVSADISPDAIPYDAYDLRRAVILVGNEPRGLSPEAKASSDDMVTIPMADDVESLNVAAATAVLCFEAARQRRKHTP